MTVAYLAVYWTWEGRMLDEIIGDVAELYATDAFVDGTSNGKGNGTATLFSFQQTRPAENALNLATVSTPPLRASAPASASATSSKLPHLSSRPLPSSPPNRVLLGIFTTSRKSDVARRKLIRKSYLSSYHILNQVDLAKSDESVDRLCSLKDLLDQKNHTVQDCWIVYTFVMGAFGQKTLSAPTDLTHISDTSFPFTVDHHPSRIHQTTKTTKTTTTTATTEEEEEHEPDIIYLNIRENMNEGKTGTWFKYASTILPAKELGIDLIAKVDADTVLFPRPLLEELNTKLHQQFHIKRPATGVYGGIDEIANGQEVPYMQGGFYFFSRDVAQHLTSPACPRDQVLPYVQSVLHGHGVDLDRAEDLEMGCLVEHCWNNRTETTGAGGTVHFTAPQEGTSRIRKVFLDPKFGAGHGVLFKPSQGFRVKWKSGLSWDLFQLRLHQLQNQYPPKGCPTKPEDVKNELEWFDGRPHMIQAKDRFARRCSLPTNPSQVLS